MGLDKVNAELDENRQWTPLLILVQDKERWSQSDRLSPTSPGSAERFKIYDRWSEKQFCDMRVVGERWKLLKYGFYKVVRADTMGLFKKNKRKIKTMLPFEGK